MRLLVITPHFAPDTAPTGTIVTELVKHWCAQGHQVHVITSLPWYKNHEVETDWKNRFIDKEIDGPMKITRVYPFPNKKSNLFIRGLGFLSFSFLTLIVSLFSKGPFDAVLSLSPPITLGPVGKFASIRHRCFFVFNVQDIFPDAAIETGMLRSKSIIRALKKFEKVSYNSSDLLTVLSKDMEDNVNRKLSKKKKAPTTAVIPNFAYTEFFNAREGNQYRRENNLEGKIVVMYAGNLGYSQPLELIVDSAIAHADKKNLLYVVNGGGVKTEYIKSEAAKITNLVFVDYQPFEYLPQVLSSADIHLLLLKSGLGNVSVPSKIYNIFASGKPVVASVDPGTEVERIILDAQAGFVVPPNETEAFHEAIEKLSDDPSLREKMGTSALSWANKWHSSEAVSHLYMERINELKTNNNESLI